MSNESVKFVLAKPATWQFRRAQGVAPALAQAVSHLCELNPEIEACYLLDTRKDERSESKLTIALSLANEEEHMERIAVKIQEMLRQFPEIAKNAAIMSAKPFERSCVGAPFYVRRQGLKRFLFGWFSKMTR
jgi:hypothetical protein